MNRKCYIPFITVVILGMLFSQYMSAQQVVIYTDVDEYVVPTYVASDSVMTVTAENLSSDEYYILKWEGQFIKGAYANENGYVSYRIPLRCGSFSVWDDDDNFMGSVRVRSFPLFEGGVEIEDYPEDPIPIPSSGGTIVLDYYLLEGDLYSDELQYISRIMSYCVDESFWPVRGQTITISLVNYYTIRIAFTCPPNESLSPIEFDTHFKLCGGESLIFRQAASPPAEYDVKGHWVSDDEFNVTLSKSQSGVTYRLLLDDSYTGISRPGNGASLCYSGLYDDGIYTIRAVHENDSLMMSGSAILDSVHKYVSSNYIIKETLTTKNSEGPSYRDITFYDGLGYPVQEQKEDWFSSDSVLIRPIRYDALHHEDSVTFLPYPVAKTPRFYHHDAISAQASYYSVTFDGESAPWSNKTYQTGYYGHMTEEMLPGQVLRERSKRRSYSYRMNRADEVKRLVFNSSYDLQWIVTCPGYYPSGSLSVTETINADSDTTLVYTDPYDRIVCSRQIMNGEDIDTRTVYDDWGRERLIIQPEGASSLPATINDNSLFARQYCFTITYDSHGRIVQRGIPGGGLEEFVYDGRDRKILSRDAVMANAGLWIMTEYDNLDRETGSYVISNNQSRSYLQSMQGESVPIASALSSNILDTLCRKEYYITGYDAPTDLPFQDEEDVDVYPNEISRNVKGLLKKEVRREMLRPSDYHVSGITNQRHEIVTGYYYDNHGHVLQRYEKDSEGWENIYSNLHDFCGNIVQSVEHHRKTNGGGDILVTTIEYDKRGNLINKEISFNTDAELTTSYSYDALGRQCTKVFDSGFRGCEIMTHDINGRITSSTNTVSGNDVNFSYFYESPPTPGTIPSYENKISEITFSNQTKSYTYDRLGRVTEVRKLITGGNNSLERFAYNKNANMIKRVLYNDRIKSDSLSFYYIGNELISYFKYGMGGAMIGIDQCGRITYDESESPTVYEWDIGGTMRRKKNIEYGRWFGGVKYRADNLISGAGLRFRGSFVYSKDLYGVETLEDIKLDDGRLVFTAFSHRVELFVCDHLGSVLMGVVPAVSGPSTSGNAQYLAFGKRIGGDDSANRWRYSGQEEMRIGTPSPVLDYGARVYDPNLCRWLSPDAMALDYPSISPFAFCAGDPINMSDFEGDFIYPRVSYLAAARTLEKYSHNSNYKTIGYAMQEPYIAIRVGIAKEWYPLRNGISKVAGQFSTNITKAANIDNPAQGAYRNALRHTIWQAIITAQYGSQQAERIGMTHENDTNIHSLDYYYSDIDKGDEQVDLRNNVVGRIIGQLAEGSIIDIVDSIVDYSRNVGLWVLEKTEDNNYRVVLKTITEQQYKDMKEELLKLNNYGKEE